MDVAILTEPRYLAPSTDVPYNCQVLLEDAWVLHHLKAAGLEARRVAWSDATFDWSSVRAALFRTTWDYFERFDEFVPWLERISGATQLINPAALVRWNMDKHYLGDLAQAGVPVVPTIFVDLGTHADLAALLGERGWREAVTKPAVSGGARLTHRVALGAVHAHQAGFDACVAAEDMLVQPFVSSVLHRGEVSLIAIDGQVTHGIRKTPKSGDFRVQDDHGGVVHPHVPEPREIAVAEQALAACPVRPLYARIDLVDLGGALHLMELELIEPELFFRFCPAAAEHLARAVAAALG